MATLSKTYEPSHIRRGRLSTSPTWWVLTDEGTRWSFRRKKDAQAFIDRGCVCPEHSNLFCFKCGGKSDTCIYTNVRPEAIHELVGNCIQDEVCKFLGRMFLCVERCNDSSHAYDETYVGGKTRGEGKGVHHGIIVAGAVEVRTRKPSEPSPDQHSKATPRRGGRYAGDAQK